MRAVKNTGKIAAGSATQKAARPLQSATQTNPANLCHEKEAIVYLARRGAM
jgi:hypothetical protein